MRIAILIFLAFVGSIIIGLLVGPYVKRDEPEGKGY